jgi:hypothetical protein
VLQNVDGENIIAYVEFINELMIIFQFKTWNLEKIAEGTEMEQLIPYLLNDPPYSDTEKSDVVRFTLLAKYGGLYVDVDTLFLRDMMPLAPLEFTYLWSVTGKFNTAVIRLFRNGTSVNGIIKGAKERYLRTKKKAKNIMLTCNPNANCLRVCGNGFIRMPSMIMEGSLVYTFMHFPVQFLMLFGQK